MPLRPILSPFSHLPGDSCIIPLTSWSLKAYPTRLELTHLVTSQKIVLSLDLTGPMGQFTIMQDLKRHFVRVFLKAVEGFVSLRLFADEKGLQLFLERSPERRLGFSLNDQKMHLKHKEKCQLSVCTPNPFSQEEIHFGCHKKQDWELVKRRLNLEEILPIWFALGQSTPEAADHEEGTAILLKECERFILEHEREKIGFSFIKLFQAGFYGIMLPRLVDTDYLGILPSITNVNGACSPLILLTKGAKLIRKLLIDFHDEVLLLLPCLPVELHTGKLSKIQITPTIEVDLEWSKKTIRRVILRVKKSQSLQLKLQKGIKSFRLRTSKQEKGKRLQVSEKLHLEAEKRYLIDRFEK